MEYKLNVNQKVQSIANYTPTGDLQQQWIQPTNLTDTGFEVPDWDEPQVLYTPAPINTREWETDDLDDDMDYERPTEEELPTGEEKIPQIYQNLKPYELSRYG